MMKLYASTTSPYARKVRICLIELGIDCDFIVESPSDSASHVARMNPLGKVPLLECDNGEPVFNSPMIVEYIDSLTPTQLIPSHPEQRWQVQRWHALGDGIIDAVVARMLEARRSPDKQDLSFISKQEGKVAAALLFAAEHYSGGPYLFGDRFCLADIALGVALDYIDFRYPHDWRVTQPQLAAWHSSINQRSSFRQSAPPE
jgi:glutathione S-transferase